MFLRFIVVLAALLFFSCTQAERDNIHDPGNNISYGYLYDSRDEKTYKTIAIGKQTWMAENLNFECYRDQELCDEYGSHYEWTNATIACPKGWHLPSNEEWQALINYVGEKDAGKKLREIIAWNGESTDNYYFSALPNGGFYDGRRFTCWWSNTESDANNAYRYCIYQYQDTVSILVDNKFHNYSSVRCIKGEANYSYYCNESEYDPETEFCFNDVFYSRCSFATYDPVNEGCCNNNDTTFTIYDKETKICENGIVKKECGEDFYDSETEFCSNNLVYPLCKGKTYNVSNEKCLDNIIKKTCGEDFYDSETEFCSNNLVYPLCNGKTYNVSNEKCLDNIIKKECGEDFYDTKTEFCFENAVYSFCNGETYNANIAKCENNVVLKACENIWYNPYSELCIDGSAQNKETFTDSRDGKVYKYVLIGEQTWMAENLNYAATGSTCYDNIASNCEKYGRLYNWAAAMAVDIAYNINSYAATETHKGICPTGWHLPSDSEWTVLVNYIAYSINLKTVNGWNNNEGTDDYGFSALPGGYAASNGNFSRIAEYGYWWSTTEYNTSNAYVRYITSSNANKSYYEKTNMYSIRCVKD